MTGLPRPARRDFDFVLAGLDSDPDVGHGAWFEQNRNRTFHYSRLGRRGLTVGQTRFHFADQVALEWLPPADQHEHRLTRMSDQSQPYHALPISRSVTT